MPPPGSSAGPDWLGWLGDYPYPAVGLDHCGNLYFGDPDRGGAVYKAVPHDRGDLARGGTVYHLVVTTTAASRGREPGEAPGQAAEAEAMRSP